MKKVWEKWKKIAEKIGNFQVTVVFSLLYFILATPLGLITQVLADFLHVKDSPKWEDFKDNYFKIKDLKKQ
ncbi:MAG: hypothetical protein HYW45_00405 [Candidatus Daviesbacteria bacterium]|nr:MAG: hypothetical protein HYW45_00405 [Candidatus Daviesbacteria bacterium]